MRRGREKKRESEKGTVREKEKIAEQREKYTDAGGDGNQVRQPSGSRT